MRFGKEGNIVYREIDSFV